MTMIDHDYVSGLFGLDGEVAVVVGGAGGLGRAIAAGLNQAGALVVVADQDLESARRVADGCGDGAVALAVDVTSRASVAAASRQTLAQHGRVDILVNCAGISRWAPAEDFPEDDWCRVIDVNLKGTFFCCQEFGRPML